MSNTEKNTTFLPDFCSPRIVFVVILSAELLAIILTLSQLPWGGNNLYTLAAYSLFIQWIALTCTGILCLLRRHIQHLSEYMIAIICYLIAIAVTLIISEIAWQQLSQRAINLSLSAHLLFLCKSVGISAVVSALVLRYLYIQQQWRTQLQVESEARFQALQSRIRPHFLFNCMNTIAGLIRTQPQSAEDAVHDLADLFRASLSDVGQLSTLADERQICEQYLRIEKLRLGDRLQINWQMDEQYNTVKVPALCLQPLIENAIYHGIEPLAAGGCIEILCVDNGKDVHITISNPITKNDNKNSHKGNQIAQTNIGGRLQALYKRENLLQVKESDDNYIVELIIPVEYEDFNR